jgi:hypothetical protein
MQSPMIYDPADSDCENEESLRTLTVKIKSSGGISLLLCCASAECGMGRCTAIKKKMTALQRNRYHTKIDDYKIRNRF